MAPVEQVTVHSNRGSQTSFASRKFRAVLADARLLGSMAPGASAGDNAAMENCFSLLQKDVLDRQASWATREDLQIAIVTWIERTYTVVVASAGSAVSHRSRSNSYCPNNLSPWQPDRAHTVSTRAGADPHESGLWLE